MSFAERFSVTVTTDASGDATAYTDTINHGILSQVRYVKTDYAAGVAALYAGGGSAVLAPIALAKDRIKIVVGSGGDTKVGVFHFLMV